VIKTEVLYNCIDFINKWDTLSFEDHLERSKGGKDLYGESRVEPFRRELLENLVLLNDQQRNDVITLYAHELFRSIDDKYFEAHQKIHEEPDSDWDEERLEAELDEEVMEEKMYQGWIIHLIYSLFFELASICLIFKINFAKVLEEQEIDLHTVFNNPPIGTLEKQREIPVPHLRPVFSSKFIPEIFEILKDYFQEHDQQPLRELLTGKTNNQTPLLFLDNGSRLADTFKQLIDSEIIKGCPKKDLQDWIVKNFSYMHRGTVKMFTDRYIAEIISTNKIKCTKPIIDVKNDSVTGDKHIIKP